VTPLDTDIFSWSFSSPSVLPSCYTPFFFSVSVLLRTKAKILFFTTEWFVFLPLCRGVSPSFIPLLKVSRGLAHLLHRSGLADPAKDIVSPQNVNFPSLDPMFPLVLLGDFTLTTLEPFLKSSCSRRTPHSINFLTPSSFRLAAYPPRVQILSLPSCSQKAPTKTISTDQLAPPFIEIFYPPPTSLLSDPPLSFFWGSSIEGSGSPPDRIGPFEQR